MKTFILYSLFFFNCQLIFGQRDTLPLKKFYMTPEFGISISSMNEASSFYHNEQYISFPIGTNICYKPFEKNNIYFKFGITDIKRGGYQYYLGYGDYRIITKFIDFPLNIGFYSNKKNLIGGFIELGTVFSMPVAHSVETPSNITFPVGLVTPAVKSNYNILLNERIGIMIQDVKYKFLIGYCKYWNFKNRYYKFNNTCIMFSLMLPIL